MRSNIIKALSLCTMLSLCFAGAAHAQMMMEQIQGNSIAARNNLQSALQPNTPQSMVINRLKMQGYTDIAASPTDPRQYTATSSAGIPLNLTIEPRSGQVISAAPR